MISDRVLAMCELMNDLLYQKIPEGKHQYYVDQSLSLGYEAARVIKCKKERISMERLYGEAGIEIVYEEKGGRNYGVSFRAQSEYGRDGSARVLIYRDSISLLASGSKAAFQKEEEAFGQIDRETALQMHLAHEYFHYLEYCSSERKVKALMEIYDKGYVSDYLEPVVLSSLWKWQRKGRILRCSEIAAHAFAKELLELPVLPNYYDYVYLMNEKKIRPDDFEEMLRENERILG